MSETPARPARTVRRAGWALGLLTAGAVGGAALGVLPAATAQDATPTPAPSSSAPSGEAPTPPVGPDGERPTPPAELTGDVAAQVEEAVLAEYPGATVERSHEAHGPHADTAAYEAHITTADDEHLLVLLDESFAIVDTVEGPVGGPGRGGPGGPGGLAGDCGPGAADAPAAEDGATDDSTGDSTDGTGSSLQTAPGAPAYAA